MTITTETFRAIRGDGILLVKVIEETVGNPGSFPTGFRKVYKCMPCKVEFTETEGSGVTITPATEDSRAIFAGNFRNNIIVKNAYYLVFRIAGKYILDNQAAFLENQ